MSIKYPNDLVSIVRQKTFSIESKLSLKEEGEERPRQLLKDFSVFKFVIIANGIANSANLKPEKDFIELKGNTRFAAKKYREYLFECANAKTAGKNSPAYTERFKAGTLKGKSPVEVLLESGKEKGGEILNQQYKWLQENIAKNPKFASANQKLMGAIVEAAKINFDELKNIELPTAPAPMVLYDSGIKGSMKSKSSKREDGKYLCYQMTVTWDFTKDYPVNVHIFTFYAPIQLTENNGQNIMFSQRDKNSEVRNDFDLLASEWEYAIEEMEKDLELFKMINYKTGKQRAERAELENRNAAKAKNTAT